MKRFFTLFLVAAVALGCSEDIPPYSDAEQSDNTTTAPDISGNGYMTFSSLSLDVDSDVEYISSKSSTNAVDADEFWVTITNTKTNEVLEGFPKQYKDVKELSDNIEVPAGYYSVSATSYESEMPSSVWDDDDDGSVAEYSGSNEFILETGKTYVVEEVNCYQSNIRVTIELSADLKSLFKCDEDLVSGDERFEVEFEYGTLSEIFDYDETRALYFAPQDGVTTAKIYLKGCYNAGTTDVPNYTNLTWDSDLTGILPTQSRQVKIVIDNYDKGQMNVTFQIEGWQESEDGAISVINDKNLTVNLLSGLTEEQITDPDSMTSNPLAPKLYYYTDDTENPTTDLTNYLLSARFVDNDSETYAPLYKVIAVPEDGRAVTSVSLKVSEITEGLTEAFEMAALTDANGIFEVWNSTSGVNTKISPYISASTDDDNVVTLTLKYSGADAFTSYVGTQSFIAILTDDLDRSSYIDFGFEIEDARDLEIEWVGGYSFDERHNIYEDGTKNPNVEIKFTSGTGITSLRLKITSEVLSEEELGNMDLSQEMDLVNPANDYMAESLNGLGFPVRDEVEGEKELSFDITEFMMQLAFITNQNPQMSPDTDFEITVSDISGEVVKTIMVTVVNE